MPKRKVKDENTTYQVYASSWKTDAFMRGHTVIFIIIFILFLIYPYIHFILHDSETKKSEDGNIPTIQNEIKIIKENKEETENIRSKESDVSKLESTLSKLQNNQNKMAAETSNILSKLAQLEQDVNDISDKGWEKENVMKEQFENDFSAIRILEGTMRQHSEKAIGTLEVIMKPKFENVFELIQKLKEDMMQQKAHLERQVGIAENAVTKCSKENEDLSNKISNLKLEVHQQITKSNKESKENEVRGITSKHVDILQIGVIIILFIYIIRATWKENFKEKEIERTRFRSRDTRNPSEDVPLIISFSEDCKRSHEHLIRGFIDDYDSVVINNFRDMRQMRQIHAKVFIVFVDCDERNVILEGNREPHQLRKDTVEYIMNMGVIHLVSTVLSSQCCWSNIQVTWEEIRKIFKTPPKNIRAKATIHSHLKSIPKHYFYASVFRIHPFNNHLLFNLHRYGKNIHIYIIFIAGMPVVIYHLHSDSRKLEGRHLYSSKLTSIQDHPILKELSSNDRVLSIDQQFSEHQISHLKNICNV